MPRATIRTQLVRLGVLASSTALLSACAAFVLYDYFTYRNSMVRELRTYAQIIAANSTAAILFHDSKAAAETLSALHAQRHIVTAQIDLPDGTRFARYVRGQENEVKPAPPLDQGKDHLLTRDRLHLRYPIVSEGTRIASLALQSDLKEADARITRYLLITGLILFLSLGASLLIATRLQRAISRPILDLASTARAISERRDYSIRVNDPESARQDEIRQLGRTFNQMLEQIEQQDSALRRAVTARDEFLSVASHELKTPITPLLLQLQRLRKLEKDRLAGRAPALAPSLDIAEKQVKRLTILVSNLLDISRITSGRLQLQYEPVDLSALAEEVVARFQPELRSAGCSVTLHTGAPVTGTWDRSRLDQSITNLLTNAMKYGQGKPIEIWTEAVDSRARFRIRDQGIGVAPEDQARIFERFERAVSEHDFAGLGLGLWIVREIVESLNGSVQVVSAKGEGATFTIDLPRTPRANGV